MSSIENKPGDSGFTGLDTTTAPLSQTPGSLTEATNIVVRRASVIETRSGLQEMVQGACRLNSNEKPFVPTAFWVDPYATGTLASPRALRAFAFDRNFTKNYSGFHFVTTALNSGVMSQQPRGVLATRSITQSASAFASDLDARKNFSLADDSGTWINWWGQDGQFATVAEANTHTRATGTVEPRVVQYYYATSNGPALVLETPQQYLEYQPDPSNTATQRSYTYASVPLGVSEVPYVEMNALLDSRVDTGFWRSNLQVQTYAYRALYKQGDRFGAPCNIEIAVSDILNWQPTKVSKVSAATIRLEFGKAPPACAAGTLLQIRAISDATKAIWVGNYTLSASGSTYLEFTAPSTNTAAVNDILLWSTVTDYRTACTPMVWVYRDPYLGGGSNAPLNSGDIILYRTKIVNQDVGVGATDPGDEMFEVSRVNATTPYRNDVQGWLSGGNGFSTGFNRNMVCFTDTVRDSDLGDFLYTNPSQEGIAKANNQPPFCTIAESFAQTMFWSGVTDISSIAFDIIGFDLLDATTQTILRFYSPGADGSPQTYWEFQIASTEGSDLPNPGTPVGYTMHVVDDPTLLPADRIERLARSIVRVINASINIPCTASYASGWQDNPGKIVLSNFVYPLNWLEGLFNRTIKTSQDVTQASTYTFVNKVTTVQDPAYAGYYNSNGGVNNNALQDVKNTQGTAAYTSVITALGFVLHPGTSVLTGTIKPVPNRIMYSKPQIAHAVPLLNFIDLPKDVTIQALRSTSGRLNIITNRGIWELTGSDEADFSLRERDVGVRCWAPGAVNVINDNLFVLTEQGVRVYGDGTLISRSVDDLILPVRDVVVNSAANLSSTGDNIVTSAVDEYYGEYLLVMPDLSRPGVNHILRFNTNTKAWTVTKRSVTGLFFHPDFKRMVYGMSDGTALIERRADRAFSLSDEFFEVNGSELSTSVQREDGLWETNGNILDASVFTVSAGALRVGQENKSVTTGDLVYWEQVVAGAVTLFGVVHFRSVETSATGVQFYVTDAAIPAASAAPDGYRVWLVKPIPVSVEFVPFRGQTASMRKKWSELVLHLRGNNNGDILLATASDEQRGHREVRLDNPHYTRGFGTYPFGKRPFGDPTTDGNTSIRTYVPQPHNSSRALTVRLSTSGFNQDLTLQGLSAVFHDQSGKVGR